jgi:hypothetical protein
LRTVARDLEVRELRAADTALLSEAFRHIGWHKPVAQFLGYLEDQ